MVLWAAKDRTSKCRNRLATAMSTARSAGGASTGRQSWSSHGTRPASYTPRYTARSSARSIARSASTARRRARPSSAPAQRPDTAAETEHRLDYLTSMLYEKIVERTKRSQDQYREAYRMFGSPEEGITFKEFRRQLVNIGVLASEADLRALFHRYDADGSGDIDFRELVKGIMPKDHGFDTFKAAERRRHDHDFMARAMKHGVATVDTTSDVKDVDINHLADMLQRKILERVKQPQNTLNEAFRMFGSPQGRITEDEFLNHLVRFNIQVPEAAGRALFRKIDDDNSGHLDFQELVRNVMGTDYGHNPYGVTLANKHEYDYIAQAARLQPKTLKTFKSSPPLVKDWIELVRSKLLQRVARGSDEFREAYRTFQSSGSAGVDLKDFGLHMQRLGLEIPKKDLEDLFHYIDEDNSGFVDFHELLRHVLFTDLDKQVGSGGSGPRTARPTDRSSRAARPASAPSSRRAALTARSGSRDSARSRYSGRHPEADDKLDSERRETPRWMRRRPSEFEAAKHRDLLGEELWTFRQTSARSGPPPRKDEWPDDLRHLYRVPVPEERGTASGARPARAARRQQRNGPGGGALQVGGARLRKPPVHTRGARKRPTRRPSSARSLTSTTSCDSRVRRAAAAADMAIAAATVAQEAALSARRASARRTAARPAGSLTAADEAAELSVAAAAAAAAASAAARQTRDAANHARRAHRGTSRGGDGLANGGAVAGGGTGAARALATTRPQSARPPRFKAVAPQLGPARPDGPRLDLIEQYLRHQAGLGPAPAADATPRRAAPGSVPAGGGQQRVVAAPLRSGTARPQSASTDRSAPPVAVGAVPAANPAGKRQEYVPPARGGTAGNVAAPVSVSGDRIQRPRSAGTAVRKRTRMRARPSSAAVKRH